VPSILYARNAVLSLSLSLSLSRIGLLPLSQEAHEHKLSCSIICCVTPPIIFCTMFLRNEALRVAYIDEIESVKNGKLSTEYYSKLVKADIHGKDKVSH
jgi:hypothetical protein